MSSVKISALPGVSSLLLSDIFPLVQSGVTSKVSLSDMIDFTTTQSACRLATTGALTATYNNGSSGVGATLVNAGALAALSIDGVAVVADDRILVKDQAAPLQNGIYIVTTIGSGATAWVLTRASDYDAPSDVDQGDFFTVGDGTDNAKTQWIQIDVVATIGVDDIEFESNVVAGTGITKTNNTISLTDTGLLTSIAQQVFTSNDTYTPTAGMEYCIVEMVGAGGGGGGANSAGAGEGGGSGGGGAGGYARKLYTAANIGASAAVVIGAAGAGGAAGNNPGTAGGNSTFTPAGTGLVLTCTGGAGGSGIASSAGISASTGGNGSTAVNGDINIKGGNGYPGWSHAAVALLTGGGGGSSVMAPGATGTTTAGTGAAGSGTGGYGAGGDGARAVGGTDRAGGAGGGGLCIVTEFISI